MIQRLNTLYEPQRDPVGNPYIHNQTNWVGLFCRCESKVKIWFADGFGLWQSEDYTYGGCVMRNVLVSDVTPKCGRSFARTRH